MSEEQYKPETEQYKPETLLLHGGQEPDETGAHELFRYIEQHLMYLRIQNMRKKYLD